MSYPEKFFRIVVLNPRRETLPPALCLHGFIRDVDLLARKSGKNLRLTEGLSMTEGMKTFRLGGKSLSALAYLYPYAKSHNVLGFDDVLPDYSHILAEYKDAFGNLGSTLKDYLTGVPEHIVFHLPNDEWEFTDRLEHLLELFREVSPIVLVEAAGKRMAAL